MRMVIRFTRDYILRYRFWFAAGAIFLYLTNWMAVQIPLQLQQALDALQHGEAASPVVRRVAIAILAIGAGLIVIRSLSRLLFFSPGRYIEADLREDLLHHLLQLRPDYYDRHPSGEILSKLTNDIASVRALAGFASLQAVNVVMGIGLSLYKMIGIHALLTGYCMLPILVIFIGMQGGMRRIFSLVRQSQEALAELSAHVLSSYNGIAVVRAFHAEAAFSRRFSEKNERSVETQLRMGLLRAFLLPLLSLTGSISLFVVLFYGGSLVARHSLSVGELAAMIGLIAVMLPALMSFGWLINVVQRGVVALARLYDILDTPTNGAPFMAPGPGGFETRPYVRVRNLSFAYPTSSAWVLNDLSFDLYPGEVLGIFGKTGAGKSTLFSLLTRLYEPGPGQIFLQGQDGLGYSLDEYRRHMALVPQRPFLFSATIADNIAMGAEAPVDEALARVIEMSELQKDIGALPQGIHTVVGPRGMTLSGGQRQRVTLARALLSDAPLLLLDDVLAAVDHATEEALIRHLYDHKRTTIIISHRLSALRRADRILVMDKGRLVAMGTHDELVAQGGLYARVWERQRLETHA